MLSPDSRRCEWCDREHGATVLVIAGGGWLDPETSEWYDDQGQSLGRCRPSEWPVGCLVKTIRVLPASLLDYNKFTVEPNPIQPVA